METREEHTRDINSTQSGLIEQVGQITGGHHVVARIVETGCG